MANFPSHADIHRGALLKDLRLAAGARIKAATYADAARSKEEIDAVAAEIARFRGGFVSTAPLKSDERATQKVTLDYRGDWHQIKDIARLTIIVPTAAACTAVVNMIQYRYFIASKGRGVLDIKIVDPERDPCGYSSTTVFVRASTGRIAEIQVNIPEIIYAKQSESSVVRTITRARYDAIKTRFQLEGGLGHHLYELVRAPTGGLNTKAVQDLSKDYYKYFRGGGFDRAKRDDIRGRLQELGLF
jgi:hypothetical protein